MPKSNGPISQRGQENAPLLLLLFVFERRKIGKMRLGLGLELRHCSIIGRQLWPGGKDWWGRMRRRGDWEARKSTLRGERDLGWRLRLPWRATLEERRRVSGLS